MYGHPGVGDAAFPFDETMADEWRCNMLARPLNPMLPPLIVFEMNLS